MPIPKKGESHDDYIERCMAYPDTQKYAPGQRRAVCESLWKKHKNEVEMPYANEHSCRLRDPDDFKPDSFRRTSRESDGKKYDVIMGRLKGEDTMTEQAYRYSKDVWSASEARSHCKEHDGSFEAAKKESENRAWYRIQNVAQFEADIYLLAEIGGLGVTAGDFIRDLKGMKARRINLHINSPGGDVFDAITILTALRQQRAEIITYVDGLAASAASVVAMAGDKVIMAPHTYIMIHPAQGLTIGNADDHRKMGDLLDMMTANIADIYAEKAGGTQDEWKERMNAESWYSAEEAVAIGLADEVGDGEGQISNSFDLSRFKNVPAALLARMQAPEEEEEPIDWAALFEEAFEEAVL
jgi:ATP-dependent protease ClpP protease subunit